MPPNLRAESASSPKTPQPSPPRAALRADPLAECVVRMAAGDQAALAQVYDATVSRVHALAYRMLGSVPAAEEVVSDVYFQAWRTAASYDRSRSAVQTWLLVMCRSRALDALRARDPSSPAIGLEGFDPPAEDCDPQDLLESVERDSRLRACVAALIPVQRQLVALAFYRGYSHSEIAAFSQLPLGSVKSHIRSALRHIRLALEGETQH